MTLDFLEGYYIPVVVASCLVIGYCVKHTPILRWVDNHLIPCLLAVIGAVIGCVAYRSINLENIVYGAFSGLASVGFHQIFAQWIERREEAD